MNPPTTESLSEEEWEARRRAITMAPDDGDGDEPGYDWLEELREEQRERRRAWRMATAVDDYHKRLGFW